MSISLRLFALVCLASLPAPLVRDALAQVSFQTGANATVRAIVLDPAGNILVGGQFTQLTGRQGPVIRHGIARLTAAGEIDPGFNPDADGTVKAIARQQDGMVLIGGLFSSLAGGAVPRNSIARIEVDGSVDPLFDPGADGDVNDIVVQPDGKILVAGSFTALAGSCARLCRLNPDGSLDSAFQAGADGPVLDLVLQPDGRVLAGGFFEHLGGGGSGNAPVRQIGRLNVDGSIDGTFSAGANSFVFSLGLQRDGKVIVGGFFTELNGVERNRIGRLNSDGTLDESFNPGADDNVRVVAVQPDGRILMGGDFTSIGGGSGAATTRTYIGRLNANGVVDATFAPALDDFVTAIAIQSNGRVLVGGNFQGAGSPPSSVHSRLVRVLKSGRIENDHSFNHTPALIVQHSNSWIGGFSVVDGAAQAFVPISFVDNGAWRPAATGDINGDGTTDIILQHANSWVAAWLMQSDGTIAQFVPVSLTDSGGWKVMAAGDVDGDGIDDIVLQHANTFVGAWRMGLDAMPKEFLSIALYDVGGWLVAGATDLNGDGIGDIVLQHTSSYVGAWLMNSRGLATDFLMLAGYDVGAWKASGTADVNNDGIGDVLLQHPNSWIAAWTITPAGIPGSFTILVNYDIGEWRLNGKR